MKQLKNVFAILTLLFTALFIACSDGNGGDDKDNGASGDSIVCTYYMKNDTSVYYVFYGDGSVEYYSKGELQYKRGVLRYKGNPKSKGTVDITINTGTLLVTFKVSYVNKVLVPTVELVPGFPVEYTLTLDGENNNGENSGTDKENTNGSGESENGENGGTESPEEPSTDIDESPLMFMGFDNVVTIEKGTDITGITNTIYSLTSDTTLKFKGGINSITLTTVAAAIGTNDSVKIALDFSEATGITEWTNKLAGQKTLYAISLPGTVTSVQKDAFTNCTNLKAITVPCSITAYPSKTVSYSPYTSYYDGIIVNFSGTLADWLQSSAVLPSGKKLYLNGETVGGTITIPDSVNSIRNDAFKNCSDITNVEIPDSVTSIGSRAFDGCSKLINVQIPTGVTRIEGYMFNNCTGLATVTIPDKITEIGSGAFYGCSRLTSITIPNSVTSIGFGAFQSCTTLKEVIIADGDEPLNLDAGDYGNYVATVFYACPLETLYLGRNLFYSARAEKYSPFYNKNTLTSVKIGNNVTSLGDYIFSYCTELTTITLPVSLTSIGQESFFDTNLTTINYRGTEEQWKNVTKGKNCFYFQEEADRKIVYNYTDSLR